jgi:hypothetical protein
MHFCLALREYRRRLVFGGGGWEYHGFAQPGAHSHVMFATPVTIGYT